MNTMTQSDSSPKQPTIIKKYANRRLYDTGSSTYVTLEDLAQMVKAEEDFVVIDAKRGGDLTRSVLTQIIFEQENKGQSLLPISFLRQLIRFYGDSMQNLVPSYLEFSIESLTKEQEKFRQHATQAFGSTAIEAIEDHVRRNAQMFERTMQMFVPFTVSSNQEDKKQESSESADKTNDLDALKQQLDDMQKKLHSLSDDKKTDDKKDK